jgi:thioredoxin 1
MSIDVTNADFQSQILDADKPALVDFWAPWCGPCQMMHPVLDSLAEKYKGRVIVARVNIDEADNQALAQQYQIRAIPYLGIFKSGELFEEIIGVRPEQDLVDALDRALAEN